jgi:hypothetical protein
MKKLWRRAAAPSSSGLRYRRSRHWPFGESDD